MNIAGRARTAVSGIPIIRGMNNFEHTEPSAQGKHGTQRPDLQRVRVDAPRSPYRNTPRSAAQHASAQQVAQPAAQQATTPLPGRHAAQPTAAMPGRHTAQGARNAQPAAAIPGQQPTAALPADSTQAMPDGKRKRGRGRKSRRGDAPRKKSFLSRQVEAWCTRVLGAVNDGGLAEQEAEYASGRTTRDFAWNTIGVGLWGCVFPVLTIVVTQLAGAEQAGMFSLAFVTALLLMFVGNYGMRNFQASDLDEEYSFADYQANRVLTCVIMLVAGLTYCNIRGYTDQMWLMSLGVYLYKMVDALADVYEGRLQQKDKLYLAGMSQAFRSAAALIGFTFALLITRNVGVSSIVMAVVAAATFVVFTFPLAKLETPKSRRVNVKRVVNLLVQCFPLFVALFMYNLIDNMPKFVMEGALSYDNQLYYNAMYFPAHTILMISAFVYKPQLVRLARIWDDPEKRHRFDLLVLAMIGVIALTTGVMALFMGTIGIPMLNLMYGLDFEQFRSLVYVMVGTGGVCACVDFLYQIITVLRAQSEVTLYYGAAFAFSVPVSMLLVNFAGLSGAVVGSLVCMAILLLLLLLQFFTIRQKAARL